MIDIEQSLVINILRITLCLVILGYSCYTDWKIRRASIWLWDTMTFIGVFLLLYELIQTSFDYDILMSFALSYIFITMLVLFIYYFINNVLHRGSGTGFGGADANALMALCVLFPYYPILHFSGITFPLIHVTSISAPFWPIFTLAAFGDALVLTIVLPLTILFYNIVKVPLSELKQNKIQMFLGYRMTIETAKARHVRLMHDYKEVDGKIVLTYRPFKSPELTDDLYKQMLKWKKAGKIGDLVWITPKIPMLIPITLGVITAIIYGDLLTQILSIFIVR